MKQTILPLFLLSTCISLTAGASEAVASERSNCDELVKECFAYSGAERESCFKAVSIHSFCHDTSAGDLATKRSQFSSLTPPEEDGDGPSFIGQQLVDRPCVDNFDNAWSGALVKGSVTKEQYTNLENTLRQCSRAPSSDLFRP
jgi:hypothetical protein